MLVPTPPRPQAATETAASPHQHIRFSEHHAGSAAAASPQSAVVVIKGVSVPRHLVLALSRDEVGARKAIREEEAQAREDAEFLIAVARSKYRAAATSPARTRAPATSSSKGDDEVSRALALAGRSSSSSGNNGAGREADDVERDVIMTLFLPESPHRGVPQRPAPETRAGVLAQKKASTALMRLQNEEAELRRWVARLEAKLREPIVAECVDTYVALTGPVRLEREVEPPARVAVEQEEEHERWELARRARRERPPFNVPPPPPPTFEQSEEIARAAVAAAELEGRKACHDFIVLRYGVRIFSVNRVESVERYDIEDTETVERQQLIANYFHRRFRCPILALMGFHAPPPQTTRHADEAHSLALRVAMTAFVPDRQQQQQQQ